MQRRVREELTPRMLAANSPMSERYECAALIGTWNGASPLRVADLWLGAAWCCIEEDDAEAERFYRRHAAWSFEESLSAYHGVDDEERAMITYLVGELWRRIGDQARANTWFDRVPGEADPQDTTWVRWARTQHDRPAEWFV